MDTTVFFSILGSLSVFANRVAEGIKRGLKLKFPTLGEDVVGLITLVVSFIAAFIGAAFIGFNLFDVLPANPYTPNIPPIVGVIGAAAVATFGSEGLHWFLDFLEAGTKRVEAPASGGFSQKTETTFVAPKPESNISATVQTPAGSATVAPTIPPTETINISDSQHG